jgi:hypothetical protein
VGARLIGIEETLSANGSVLSEKQEKSLLAKCETVIEKYVEGLLAVGRPLQVIRENLRAYPNTSL